MSAAARMADFRPEVSEGRAFGRHPSVRPAVHTGSALAHGFADALEPRNPHGEWTARAGDHSAKTLAHKALKALPSGKKGRAAVDAAFGRKDVQTKQLAAELGVAEGDIDKMTPGERAQLERNIENKLNRSGALAGMSPVDTKRLRHQDKVSLLRVSNGGPTQDESALLEAAGVNPRTSMSKLQRDTAVADAEKKIKALAKGHGLTPSQTRRLTRDQQLLILKHGPGWEITFALPPRQAPRRQPAQRKYVPNPGTSVHEKVGHTGKGLWGHKELQLPAYMQHVANDLIAKGHPESEASHMAVGIVQSWAHGGKGVSPEVVAKAVAAVAEWEALRVKAHALTAAKSGKRAIDYTKHEPRLPDGKWMHPGAAELLPKDAHGRPDHMNPMSRAPRGDPQAPGQVHPGMNKGPVIVNGKSINGGVESSSLLDTRTQALLGPADNKRFHALPAADQKAALKAAKSLVPRGIPARQRQDQVAGHLTRVLAHMHGDGPELAGVGDALARSGYNKPRGSAQSASRRVHDGRIEVRADGSTHIPLERAMTMVERRYTPSPVELREAAGQTRIGGYAAVFGKLSRNLGGFVERVEPSFFNETRADGWPDVLCRYNHDDNMLLGTTPNTLQLQVDATGLSYAVNPPEARQDIVQLVARGDVKRSSFAFRKINDDWGTTDQGYPMRKLEVGQLIDVAPVNSPAYAETSAGLRSLADHMGADFAEVRSMIEEDPQDGLKVFFRSTYATEPIARELPWHAAAVQLHQLEDPWRGKI